MCFPCHCWESKIARARKKPLLKSFNISAASFQNTKTVFGISAFPREKNSISDAVYRRVKSHPRNLQLTTTPPEQKKWLFFWRAPKKWFGFAFLAFRDFGLSIFVPLLKIEFFRSSDSIESEIRKSPAGTPSGLAGARPRASYGGAAGKLPAPPASWEREDGAGWRPRARQASPMRAMGVGDWYVNVWRALARAARASRRALARGAGWALVRRRTPAAALRASHRASAVSAAPPAWAADKKNIR